MAKLAARKAWMRLSASDADRVHHETCRRKSGGCARCIWANKKDRWARRFLINNDPDHGCWVKGGHLTYGDNLVYPLVPGLGCTVCTDVCAGKWSRYGVTGLVTAKSLTKHAHTEVHQFAVLCFLEAKARNSAHQKDLEGDAPTRRRGAVDEAATASPSKRQRAWAGDGEPGPSEAEATGA